MPKRKPAIVLGESGDYGRILSLSILKADLYNYRISNFEIHLIDYTCWRTHEMRRRNGSPWKVGDKSKVLCKNCKDIRPTTCQRRTVKFNGEVYHSILCGVCDTCGRVASLQQVIKVA